LALPLLSPYAIENTGYRFVSGEVQADIPVKINQNQIDGKIDLILYNPAVKAVKTEGPERGKAGKIRLNMSLQTALKLLRDKQNDVKLNIPISGNINDPKFSVADAINRVLAKTLQSSALSYLKYMLGPYGIGISIAEIAYKQATKIRLNPILFAAGSDDLDEAAVDYLQRVAAIMKEYPEVQVSVCGVAAESDRKSIRGKSSKEDSALLELAENRTERISNQLVKLHGIAAKRIVACAPEIDSSAAGKPRAKLEI
jgi:outer membrane protein OmpA-like peptidoglycan-associated protein